MNRDTGDLPPPTEEDGEWAWRLWNSLQIGNEEQGIAGGTWDMPGVGRYHRTGGNELTLVEIHAPMHPDKLGITVWHKHDWLSILAEAIGWVMISDQVKSADSDPISEENEPKLEHIGKVHACECGLVYTLRGSDTKEIRMLVGENGNCLNPNCNIIIPLPHAGILNEINDSAVIAKAEAQEMLAIALDEDEYPAPPIDVSPFEEEE